MDFDCQLDITESLNIVALRDEVDNAFTMVSLFKYSQGEGGDYMLLYDGMLAMIYSCCIQLYF